jgi:hypothetical protein
LHFTDYQKNCQTSIINAYTEFANARSPEKLLTELNEVIGKRLGSCPTEWHCDTSMQAFLNLEVQSLGNELDLIWKQVRNEASAKSFAKEASGQDETTKRIKSLEDKIEILTRLASKTKMKESKTHSDMTEKRGKQNHMQNGKNKPKTNANLTPNTITRNGSSQQKSGSKNQTNGKPNKNCVSLTQLSCTKKWSVHKTIEITSNPELINKPHKDQSSTLMFQYSINCMRKRRRKQLLQNIYKHANHYSQTLGHHSLTNEDQLLLEGKQILGLEYPSDHLGYRSTKQENPPHSQGHHSPPMGHHPFPLGNSSHPSGHHPLTLGHNPLTSEQCKLLLGHHSHTQGNHSKTPENHLITMEDHWCTQRERNHLTPINNLLTQGHHSPNSEHHSLTHMLQSQTLVNEQSKLERILMNKASFVHGFSGYTNGMNRNCKTGQKGKDYNSPKGAVVIQPSNMNQKHIQPIRQKELNIQSLVHDKSLQGYINHQNKVIPLQNNQKHIDEPPLRKSTRLIIKKYEKRKNRPRGRFINRVNESIKKYSNIMTPNELYILMKYRIMATNYYNNNKQKSIIGSNRWERKMLNKMLNKTPVNNYSHRTLSKKELETLSLNLKYIPKINVPLQKYVEEWIDFDRSLRVKNFFIQNPSKQKIDPKWLDLIPRNKNWIPQKNGYGNWYDIFNMNELNLSSFIESRKLNDPTIQDLNSLMEDESITICDADKNLGITIVDTSWYLGEIESQMSDMNTYRIEEPNIEHITMKIGECAFLIKKLIHKKVAQYIMDFTKNENWKLPKFRLIPKIHKVPMAGRPIVPSHHWLTSGLSKVLDRLLRPTLEKCQYVLKDSRELVQIIENTKFNDEIILATSDITSLYTNIDIDDCIRRVLYIHHRFNPTARTDEIKLLKEGIRIILSENYFVTPSGIIYHQIRGLAMGTPIAPLLANIYMYSLELSCLGINKIQPIIYKRYIDDIFMIFNKKDEELIGCYLNAITENTSSLTFTTKIHNSKIEFLDLVLYKGQRWRSSNILDLRTHEKELNKYLYIPWSSGHPRHLKRGFIKGEAIRHARNCSDEEEYRRKLFLFKHRLMNRGYKESFIEECFSEIDYNKRAIFINGENRLKENNLYFPITYSEELKFGELNMALRSKLIDFKTVDKKWYEIDNIVLSLKSRNNLRHTFNGYYSLNRYKESRRTECRLKGIPYIEKKTIKNGRYTRHLESQTLTPVNREEGTLLQNNNIPTENPMKNDEIDQIIMGGSTEVQNQNPDQITIRRISTILNSYNKTLKSVEIVQNKNKNIKSKKLTHVLIQKIGQTGTKRTSEGRDIDITPLPKRHQQNRREIKDISIISPKLSPLTPRIRTSGTSTISLNLEKDNQKDSINRRNIIQRTKPGNHDTKSISCLLIDNNKSEKIPAIMPRIITEENHSIEKLLEKNLHKDTIDKNKNIGRHNSIQNIEIPIQNPYINYNQDVDIEENINTALENNDSLYNLEQNQIMTSNTHENTYYIENNQILLINGKRTWSLDRKHMKNSWKQCGSPNTIPQEPWFTPLVDKANNLGIDAKYIPFLKYHERIALKNNRLLLSEDDSTDESDKSF